MGSDGSRRPFRLAVSAPIRDKKGRDYYCWVSCPIVLRQRCKIYGFDPEQASELSIEFIRAMLRDRYKILNVDGEAFDLLATIQESVARTADS